LVITIVEHHDLVLLVNEKTWVRGSGFKTKLAHAGAQVLTEEQRAVDLTTDAFLHAKHNIPVLTSGGPVVLGKL
jgi:hypothetical protein